MRADGYGPERPRQSENLEEKTKQGTGTGEGKQKQDTGTGKGKQKQDTGTEEGKQKQNKGNERGIYRKAIVTDIAEKRGLGTCCPVPGVVTYTYSLILI